MDNGQYMTTRTSQVMVKEPDEKVIVAFEYHVAYNINYGVPVLCFLAWKQGKRKSNFFHPSQGKKFKQY